MSRKSGMSFLLTGKTKAVEEVAPKVAVVTGSNKGIGYAVVKGLAATYDGHVYLTSRDVERGENAVAQLKKEGVEAYFHQLDIEDPSSIETLHNHLLTNYGGLDILVNNAAIAYKNDATESFAEQAEKTIHCNYTCNLDVCKFLFPLLKPHARVVNVSSMLGQLSMSVKGESLRSEFKSDSLTLDKLNDLVADFVKSAKAGNHLDKGWSNTAYGTSKVAFTALSRVQQRQFDKDPREDIIVTAVEPGYVNTDMSSHKGILSPEQGAEPIIYCALLPPGSDKYKGAYVAQNKAILEFK